MSCAFSFHKPRVILARPDRLGDVILTSALLPILHQAWPQTEIYLLTAPAYRPLFHQHPLLSGWINRDEALARLRDLHPTALLHFQPSPALEQAGRAAGCPRQVGYRHPWWSAPLTDACPDDRARGLRHEVEYALALATQWQPVPEEPRSWRPSLRLAATAGDSLRQKLPPGIGLGDYFVVNPTAYSESLRWPWTRFLEVCRWMHHTHQIKPILISGEAGDPSIQHLDKALRDHHLPFLNLAGQLDVAELGCLLSQVKLHLARNTGTSHLAAAVDCPQVELFIRFTGRYSLTRWKSLSPRAVQIAANLSQNFGEPNPHFWWRCAEAISVEDVCQKIQEAFAHATV